MSFLFKLNLEFVWAQARRHNHDKDTTASKTAEAIARSLRSIQDRLATSGFYFEVEAAENLAQEFEDFVEDPRSDHSLDAFISLWERLGDFGETQVQTMWGRSRQLFSLPYLPDILTC